MNKRGFASDNNSGIHPAILEAIQNVNIGHVAGYGDDIYTQNAINEFKKIFGNEIEVFFVFNGTGANILSITSSTNSFNSVICAATAHIFVDECGAPEKASGCKLIPITTKDGKLTPELIKPQLLGFGFEHHSQPKLISISQVTELGTVYEVDEIKAICKLAHQHGMLVHMDGARIANAAVSLNLPFNAFTSDAGIDVLSFGGTKNGMMFGEAVIFFNKELAENAKYIRKQSTQLYSKMRFIAAQFSAYFANDLWKINAAHANKMASVLAGKLVEIGIPITQKVSANGIFAILDDEIRDKLQKEYFFYPWDESNHEVRWMTSFDTAPEDIDSFCKALEKLLNE
jgi:threonine aldolase